MYARSSFPEIFMAHIGIHRGEKVVPYAMSPFYTSLSKNCFLKDEGIFSMYQRIWLFSKVQNKVQCSSILMKTKILKHKIFIHISVLNDSHQWTKFVHATVLYLLIYAMHHYEHHCLWCPLALPLETCWVYTSYD